MNKVYKSSSLAFEATGSRSEAIRQCLDYLKNNDGVKNQGFTGRFTWRSDDESGFTIAVYSPFNIVVTLKWNAARW